MKHRVAGRRLGRSTAHRRALFRNQVTSLIEHERIETTVAKAKELRRIADRMITYGKRNSVMAMRKVNAFVQTKDAQRKVFLELAPRFASREGGYTRVLKTRYRKGDCAPMAVVEWSETERSILTRDQVLKKEQRKSKYARRKSKGLAEALD